MESKEEKPTVYFTLLPSCAQKIKESKKNIIFKGKTFYIGLFINIELIDLKELGDLVQGKGEVSLRK